MLAWIFSFIDHLGYFAIAILIAIENIFPPILSEIILAFDGFMTHKIQMDVLGLIISATIGSLAGALILYKIGHWFGAKRLEQLSTSKLFKFLGFKKSDIR